MNLTIYQELPNTKYCNGCLLLYIDKVNLVPLCRKECYDGEDRKLKYDIFDGLCNYIRPLTCLELHGE